MKVTKTSIQPTFQPIELKITIESEEELRVFTDIVGSDFSNTMAMVRANGICENDQPLAQKMFGDIHEVL